MSLWDEPNRGRHHLANQLSTKNNVIWVNRKLDRTDKPNNFIGLEKINSNLSILHTGKSWFPDYIPRKIDELVNLNNHLRLKILDTFLKQISFKPDLIWIYDYKAINIAKSYNDKAKILYFCNDFYGKPAFKYEIKLLKLVDCVFSTDQRLQVIFNKYNSNNSFINFLCLELW